MNNFVYPNEDLSDFRFLVTGGAGFIGSNLVEYLLRNNAGLVRVLDNFSNGYRENLQPYITHPKFELIEGDIRILEDCKLAVKDVHYVSHQAALGSVPRSILDPITTNAVNISGFLNMLVAVKDAPNVRRMVYAASSSSYGDSNILPKVEGNEGRPLSPYAVTKWVNELYADVFSKVYSFPTIGLRYFNVFGQRQNPTNPYAAVIPIFMASALARKSPVIFGDGETSRDFTFVENVIQANMKAMLSTPNLKTHEVVNIAAGKSTTLNQLWEYIAIIAGCPEIIPTHSEERQGDVRASLADIGKAKQLFDYDPKFSAEKGLELTYSWYKHNPYN